MTADGERSPEGELHTVMRIETSTQIIWLCDDGILRSTSVPKAEMQLADAVEMIRAVAAAIGGIRRPICVDLTGLKSITREARNYFAGPETAAVECAAALVVRSPMARAMGNFFLGLNAPIIPTRLFTSDGPAIEWLRQYVP